MNARIIAEPPVTVKEHLMGLLAALEYGLCPPDGCPNCRAALAPKCGEHTQALADTETVCHAVAAVQAAPDDFGARREFVGVMARLAGLTSYGMAVSGIYRTTGASDERR